ncbi:hypothetical protein [Nocardia cyriacigeorgica]|uniref:hypothetical protein n=1 Tax=Nocardia cyriacigeorgica TaxID=135487 RepID=UPI0024566C1D|nr:hypothetical protein [Nocardia cyriacigeorgica]
MPDRTPAPLSDDELREIADTGDAEMLPDETVQAMAAELLAARAEIAALRNDLSAKASDFDAACRHLGQAEARIAELEVAQAEAKRIHDESPGDCYHCPRCQDADESQRDALRARVAELEQAAALAAACRPPEIHDRPTDTDLAALVRALDGTGDPAYVLGAELSQLRRLVRDFTDPDECSFDHHGGCQAHGYLSLEPGELCPHAEAKQMIAEWETNTDE